MMIRSKLYCEEERLTTRSPGRRQFWRNLKSHGGQASIVAEMLALCVASHHSGMIDCITPGGTDNLSRRMDKDDARSHFNEAWRRTEDAVSMEYRCLLQDPTLIVGVCDIFQRIHQWIETPTARRNCIVGPPSPPHAGGVD
jgi:CRISPR-associated endonuclease/helicase Cas3